MSTQITGIALRNSGSAALAAGLQVAAQASVLAGVTGYNSKGSAQFIQIHDSATTPADTAVPVFSMVVAAAANFSADFGVYGMTFVNGVYVCNSSTAPTKTIGSADCQFFARVAST